MWHILFWQDFSMVWDLQQMSHNSHKLQQELLQSPNSWPEIIIFLNEAVLILILDSQRNLHKTVTPKNLLVQQKQYQIKYGYKETSLNEKGFWLLHFVCCFINNCTFNLKLCHLYWYNLHCSLLQFKGKKSWRKENVTVNQGFNCNWYSIPTFLLYRTMTCITPMTFFFVTGSRFFLP